MDQRAETGGGRSVKERVARLEARMACVEAALRKFAELAEHIIRLDELTRQMACSDRAQVGG